MMLVQFSCSWENGSGSENIDVCLPYQVLDVIAPPYTSDFVQLFLPILENDSIAGTIRTEGEHDPVAEFIGQSLLPSFSWPKTVYVIKYFPFAQLKYNYHSAPFQLTANPTSSWWIEDVAGRPGPFGYEPIPGCVLLNEDWNIADFEADSSPLGCRLSPATFYFQMCKHMTFRIRM